MAWVLDEKEIERMLAEDGACRYEYFVRRVCETGEVWGLYRDGWATLCEGERRHLMFWPHEAYAARFRQGEWQAYEPRPIALDAFLERWLPGMKKEAIEPAVFPVAAGSTAVICVGDLEENLRHVLEEGHGEEGAGHGHVH
jgi:hypothetical protein